MKKKFRVYRDYADNHMASNCGENVKIRCKDCEARGIKLKFGVNYTNRDGRLTEQHLCKADENQKRWQGQLRANLPRSNFDPGHRPMRSPDSENKGFSGRAKDRWSHGSARRIHQLARRLAVF